MKILIVFILTAILANSQQYLGADQVIQLNCTSQNKAYYFKTMQTFSIISLSKQDQVVLTSNKITCTFQKLKNNICTFENMVKQINVSCPGIAFETPKLIQLLIQRPHKLAHQQTSHQPSKLIQVELSSGEEGIVSILMTSQIANRIGMMELSTNNNTNYDLFLISDCVEDITVVSDRFKIAVKKKEHACVIGLKGYESEWKFFKTLTQFSSNQSVYSGYLQKNVPKTYNMKDNKVKLYLVIESELIDKIKKLDIQILFVSMNGNKTFHINNFQPGLPVFDTYLYLDHSYSNMTIKSTHNIFYSLYQMQNAQNQMMITQDSYLYTEINDKKNNNSFIIELAGFNEQKQLARIILFTTSNNQTFNFTFSQCFNSLCQNSTQQSQVISNNQFTPICNHLIEEMCYVKITITNSSNGILGILPLTYSQNVQLKLNVVHQGILKRGNIIHYIVKKQTLANLSSEILSVGLSGAKVYLTYNPQCKKIYCAQYWAIGNTLEIPKQKKDLFIFIEGSMHSHYTLIIDTNNGDGIHLPESVSISHVLSQKQKRRYYLYTPINYKKSFQINCNALPNTLLLMVNIRNKSFPIKQNAAFTSKDCYIHIKPSQFSDGDVAYITIERVHETKTNINYGLMGVTQGSIILGHWRQPFHDFFQPNSSKTFKYLISNPTHDIFLKIDMYQQIEMSPITVVFGDFQTIRHTVHVNDTGTFIIDLQKQLKICQSQKSTQCYLNLEVYNFGNVGLEVSITLWQRMDPIKLILGQYQNFQTGALGEQTHFYLPVQNPQKPINIYVFSNQVQIQVIGQLWNPKDSGPTQFWPFPSFEHLANQTLDHLVYSLSASLYFGKQLLKNATANSVILITIRDKTHFQNKSVQILANPGNIQLTATNGFSTLRQDDKLEYIINNDEVYHFQFPLGNLITLQDQQIYFYNLALSGISHLAYYFSTQNYNQSTLVFSNEQKMIVKIDQFKKSLKDKKQTDHSITFVVKCIGASSCKFLASVVSSSSQYRQLTLGVPEQFYIPPHRNAIFQFNDYYNEDFKIKVQREQGFPEYKIKSCSGVKKIDCVTPLLKNQKVEDQSLLFLTGRSHELKIDTTSPYYCKGCTYYIVFYSYSQPIYGSLTITRSGQAVILKQSTPLTTQLYSDNEDSYLISTVPDSQRFVTIVPHMGKINIELIEMIQTNEKKPRVHTQNSSGKASVYLELQKTSVSIPYNLKLRSLDNQNVMYTIILSSKKNLITLQDGVPFKTTLQPNSNFKVQYDPTLKSTILVTATSPIQIKLICQDSNSSINHNHKIKYSQVMNVSLIHVDVNECSNYIIEITNKKLTNITILPNDQQIMLLPFQMAIPSLVTKKACQMYEVPIQQKTLLKIVMYICQPGNAILGISNNKNHMLNKKYQRKFTIEGDRFTEVFEYAASPGILYFQVHSQSDSIEYAIEIFPFYRQSQESKTQISLSDAYIETIPLENDSRFKLKFQPYKIVDQGVNYTVSYVVVESTHRNYLRKSLRCSMTFFDLKNPSTTFKQSYLKVEQQTNGSLTALYQPTYPHSYITIIPVIQPRPQSYTSKPSYDISELSIGKGPVFFQKFITIVMGVLEQVSGIQDEDSLNFLLIIIIVIFNIIVVSVCCVLGARHCRNSIIIERKRLATTQRQGRLGISNSLDMLESKEDIQIEIKKALEEPKPQIP